MDDDSQSLTAETFPSDVASHSIEPESAQRLWELSGQLLAA
ncbi:hypothetical protein [Arthrobacter castelli]|nr:hypothetical protein [Arthrobacter castelli]